MRREWLRTWPYGLCTVVHRGSTFVALLFAALMKAPVTRGADEGMALAWVIFVQWSQRHAAVVIFGATVLTGGTHMLRKWIGPPGLWSAVHKLLDYVQQTVFNLQPGDIMHEHRVTLFKHESFILGPVRWPLSGWLVPVERSGHSTRKTKTIFRAPDDAQNAEGFAGFVWVTNGVVHLPSDGGPLLPSPRDDANLSEYCQRTFVSAAVQSIRNKERAAQPLAFCGTPVEVKGKRWGVLVIDSTRTRIPSEADKALAFSAKALGALLEGGPQ